MGISGGVGGSQAQRLPIPRTRGMSRDCQKRHGISTPRPPENSKRAAAELPALTRSVNRDSLL